MKTAIVNGFKNTIWMWCFMGCILLTGCENPNKPLREEPMVFKQIEILEASYTSVGEYKMFLDKKTGARCLYYRNAMVVLPAEK